MSVYRDLYQSDFSHQFPFSPYTSAEQCPDLFYKQGLFPASEEIPPRNIAEDPPDHRQQLSDISETLIGGTEDNLHQYLCAITTECFPLYIYQGLDRQDANSIYY